jgi:hypothetical protein
MHGRGSAADGCCGNVGPATSLSGALIQGSSLRGATIAFAAAFAAAAVVVGLIALARSPLAAAVVRGAVRPPSAAAARVAAEGPFASGIPERRLPRCLHLGLDFFPEEACT